MTYPNQNQNNNSFLDQFAASLQRVGKSPHTVKAYTQDLAGFATWFAQTTGGDFTPQAVDPRDISEYRGYLVRNGAKPATANRKLIALRRFFQWAKRAELCTGSPFEVLERVLVRQQRANTPRWLTRSEQLTLLRAVRKAEDLRDLALMQTLLGTGLRISELADLQIVDLEMGERGGWLTVRHGKGGKARRVPLDNATRQVLAAYLEARKEEPEEELFLGQRGPISAPAVHYLVKQYAYQAQLEGVTAHTLRHTFAKNLVDAGVPLDQVATLLGHESLDTTRIYTRPSVGDLERAVRRAGGEVDI